MVHRGHEECEVGVGRRRFGACIAAAFAGLLAGSRLGADARPSPAASPDRPRHLCKGLNECKGQGGCAHGCSGHGCHGKNECRGKGGCASEVAKHRCAGKNDCKGLGGCASGEKGCAGKNSCKGRGGCEVPLKVEHTQARKRSSNKPF